MGKAARLKHALPHELTDDQLREKMAYWANRALDHIDSRNDVGFYKAKRRVEQLEPEYLKRFGEPYQHQPDTIDRRTTPATTVRQLRVDVEVPHDQRKAMSTDLERPTIPTIDPDAPDELGQEVDLTTHPDHAVMGGFVKKELPDGTEVFEPVIIDE